MAMRFFVQNPFPLLQGLVLLTRSDFVSMPTESTPIVLVSAFTFGSDVFSPWGERPGRCFHLPDRDPQHWALPPQIEKQPKRPQG